MKYSIHKSIEKCYSTLCTHDAVEIHRQKWTLYCYRISLLRTVLSIISFTCTYLLQFEVIHAMFYNIFCKVNLFFSLSLHSKVAVLF